MTSKRVALSLLRRNYWSNFTKGNSPDILFFPANTLSPSTICFNQARRSIHSSNDAMNDFSISKPKKYNFADIEDYLKSSSTTPRVLIDAREPDELLVNGTIPDSLNIPLISQPDAFAIGDKDFKSRFGFDRPAKHVELIFFCRSGVRSLRAANLALEAGWSSVGNYSGSWLDWEERGGRKQLVEDNLSNSFAKKSILNF